VKPKHLKLHIVLSFALLFLSGCFLVISHNEPAPTIVSVHLLPPKIEEKPLEKPLNVAMVIYPFDFDLKFSEKKAPVFLDYSHIPKEFIENLSSTLESGYISNVNILDKGASIDKLEQHFKFLSEKKTELALLGKIKKFDVYKKNDGWFCTIEAEYTLLMHTGEVLKQDTLTLTIDKQVFPENVTLDYQVAIAASTVFNKLYNEITKSIKASAEKIEMARIPREIKGKGIFTLRRGQQVRGKARVLVDVRIRILINEIGASIITNRNKLEEEVKKFIEEVKKNNQYKIVISIKDTSQTLYPFKEGKLVYDSNNEFFAINYITTKEFYVTPGKSLIVANVFVPKISETITKGTYVDINPEKGLTLGFNLLCETKNNYVDMVFVK